MSIGVGSFDGEAEEELGFVTERMDEVCRAFEQLGAGVPEPSVNQTEGEIEALLRRWLIDEQQPADVTVVHLIGHGRTDRSGRLSFVARDNRGVDVDRWIEKAQQEVERGGDRRRIVFLVDTCSAGAATGRQPISELGAGRGVWALGSVVSSVPAEQGKFSHWIATALDRLRGYDFTLTEGAVRFTSFVEELVRVGRRESSTWRMSVGFSLEQGDGDWPFLLNPRTAGLTSEQIHARRSSLGYVPGQEELRKDLGARMAAGEEIDDWTYFYDRASGRGLVSATSGAAFFSGRTAELKRYMAWQASRSPLLTVSGAAGAGKSGLLGVIACAAHPSLRGPFHEQWEIADPTLPEVPGVVAVHARQRSAQQVIDTIAGMSGLELPKEDEEDGAPGEQQDGLPAKTDPDRDSRTWTSGLLRTALGREQKNRLIVLDAVDESTDPDAVLQLVADLLVPEEQCDVTEASPCRILLGGRHEVIDALAGFNGMEEVTGEAIDLDTADPGAVEEDVRRYITRLLRTGEPYATGASARFVETLAKLGAQGIVRNLRPHSQWGPFLLAGLYIHYLMTLPHPPLDEGAAEAYAKGASANLPDLLEAVLTTRRGEFPALRAVLAIIARAKGNGMPRVTLRRCLKVLHADDMTDKDFEATLREASPFLRTGVDRESKTLYRIFQQGLADYLRDHPLGRDPLDARQSLDLERQLLAEIVGPFLAGSASRPSDGWLAAEPYVLQHALGHVTAAESVEHAEALLTDPYFLISFDPNQDHRAIDLCHSDLAAEYLRLVSASWRAHGRTRSASDRASIFVLDADRLDLREHRNRFAGIARDVAFQPQEAAHALLWATGGRVDSSDRYIDTGGSYARGMVFSPDGALIATSTYNDVRILETETWHKAAPPIRRQANSIAFSPDGTRLAFATGAWTRNIHFWDIRNRVLVGKPWDSQTGPVTSLAYSPDSRWLAVTSSELEASVWDLTGDTPHRATRLSDSEKSGMSEFSPDGRLLAMVGPSRLLLWKTRGWEPVPLQSEPTWAIAFSDRAGRLASLHDDSIVLRCCESLEETHRIPFDGYPNHSLAVSADGSLLAVDIENVIHVIDVASGETVNRLVVGGTAVYGLAFHPVKESLLMSSSGDGRLRLWKGVTEERVVPELTEFASGDATASPDGRFVAAIGEDEQWLTLRDAIKGNEVARVWLGKAMPNPDLYFSPDSQMLVAVGYQGTIHVIRMEAVPLSDAAQAIRVNGRPSSVQALAFSPDGHRFAVSLDEFSSGTNSIRVWDSRTLRLTARIPLPQSAESLAFAGPDKLFVGLRGTLAVYHCTDPASEELSP
ncbi:WD40 repeat domain-containing protein [Streptomyces caeruleatus]|uniref:WD40 repeat domain-containing protein n=1 Tax=Streptomyces caeruleatus TaxID=661399 RepID=UPI00131DAD62|nr:WD40 repeat domain-containing protein [Streptomyces caeruleatus]